MLCATRSKCRSNPTTPAPTRHTTQTVSACKTYIRLPAFVAGSGPHASLVRVAARALRRSTPHQFRHPILEDQLKPPTHIDARSSYKKTHLANWRDRLPQSPGDISN